MDADGFFSNFAKTTTGMNAASRPHATFATKLIMTVKAQYIGMTLWRHSEITWLPDLAHVNSQVSSNHGEPLSIIWLLERTRADSKFVNQIPKKNQPSFAQSITIAGTIRKNPWTLTPDLKYHVTNATCTTPPRRFMLTQSLGMDLSQEEFNETEDTSTYTSVLWTHQIRTAYRQTKHWRGTLPLSIANREQTVYFA